MDSSHDYAFNPLTQLAGIADEEQSNDIELGQITHRSRSLSYVNHGYNVILNVSMAPSEREYFETAWLSGILAAMSTYSGYQRRSVHLLSKSNTKVEYVVILTFSDLPSWQIWNSSHERHQWLQLAEKRGITTQKVNEYGGVNARATDRDSAAPPRISYQARSNVDNRPLPPPKWKLTIVITVGVFLGVLGRQANGIDTYLLTSLDLPTGFATLIGLCLLVPALSFAFLPAVMSLPVVDAWLKAPRSQRRNGLLDLLDNGLDLFSIQRNNLNEAYEKRIVLLENRLERLKQLYHELKSDAAHVSPRHRANSTHEDSVLRHAIYHPLVESSLQQIEDSISGPLTLSVSHRVRWEKTEEFELWADRMSEEMARYCVMRCLAINIYRHAGFLGMSTINPKRDGDPYINCFSFDTYHNLLSFVTSEGRQTLLRELDNLLEGNSLAEVSAERMMHDAFSELYVATGDRVPFRPPPVWKAMMFTILSLQMIVWPVSSNLGPILLKQGIHHILVTFMLCFINVTVNNYIGGPFVTFLFGDWLHIPRPAVQPFPWNYLDAGFPQNIRIVLSVIYFGLLYGFSAVMHPEFFAA